MPNLAPPDAPTAPGRGTRPGVADIDRATADRLAQLHARRQPARAPGSTAMERLAGMDPTPDRSHRRHAAKGSRATALVVSIVTAGGLAGFFAWQSDQTPVAASAPLPPTPATAGSTSASAPAPVAPPATSVTPTTTPAGPTPTVARAATTIARAVATTVPATAARSTGGSFSGTSVTTRFGPVQVAITVASGQITEVRALATPTGGKSDRINAAAAPVLRVEALAAQSSSLAVVSGATYTSKAYAQSLQAAIDQAKATHALPAGA